MRSSLLALAALCSQAACTATPDAPPAGAAAAAVPDAPPDGAAAQAPARYLDVWAGDADEQESDFLAVVDAAQGSADYGKVVATLPVGARATMPHHTEYETPPGAILFANGWKAGRTFMVDISNPLKPKLAGEFQGAGAYSFPHSFARLANGNVLAVFQSVGEKYGPPGGLVELDQGGRLVRAAPSATADIPNDLNWPYSLAVHPKLDRVVTTSTDMGMPPFDQWQTHDTRHVQIWTASALELLASVALPESGKGRHHIWPAEPRVLADGTVYVNTFTCGLYRLDGLEEPRPKAEFVHAFPGGTSFHDMCAVPLVYGNYWIQTASALPGLIVLDVRDPRKPVEASRLVLDKRYPMPHWIGADRRSGRVVLTMDSSSDILILRFDEKSGTLAVDETFRDAGAAAAGVSFDRADWPHGKTGKAIVHGALFGN